MTEETHAASASYMPREQHMVSGAAQLALYDSAILAHCVLFTQRTLLMKSMWVL